MKRNKILTAIIALMISALALTACGKSEFSGNWEGEKKMSITAEKAAKGDFFMSGSLHVEEGEQIAIDANLTKGSIRVELLGAPAEQSADSLPVINEEPIMKADLKNKDGASGTVPAGDYMVKATCLEKATGTVMIEVKK